MKTKEVVNIPHIYHRYIQSRFLMRCDNGHCMSPREAKVYLGQALKIPYMLHLPILKELVALKLIEFPDCDTLHIINAHASDIITNNYKLLQSVRHIRIPQI